MRVIPDEMWGPLNIFAEARGEPYEGMVAVGNVVRNRMRLKHFSDGTVAGTVLKPYQFSWTNQQDPQRQRVLSVHVEDTGFATAVRAWEESERWQAVPRDATLYHADYVEPGWARSEQTEEVARIGRHIFYRQL